MRRFLLGLGLILLSFNIVGAQAGVFMDLYGANLTGTERSINERIKAGHVPAGFEFVEGQGTAVLYGPGRGSAVQAWAIKAIDSPELIEATIQAYISEGFIPRELSAGPTGITVFFLKASGLQIDGWRITASGLNKADVEKTLKQFQAEGFNCWGISVYGGYMWYLFIREPRGPMPAYIEAFAFDPARFAASVEPIVRQGYAPWSLGFAGDQVFILFTK